MTDRAKMNLPKLFGSLIDMGCFSETEIHGTSDGFCAVSVSVADVLARRGVTTVPGRQGDLLECGLFFDDWYLYAVSDGDDAVYSLFKMREQEYDALQGRKADGDIPGVTVPFVALQTDILLDCLREPTLQNRKRINEEINRVVAFRGQRHSEVLKQYFIRTEALGAYLVAKLYTGYIASLARDGCIPVPERYAADFSKRGLRGRIPRFLEENNRDAGKVVCDHKNIYIDDPGRLTEQERLAILATHTGNVSLFSFAAEVQFHAKFLTGWAKIPIPFVGRSPYDSAIRADMRIGDAEFTVPTPYSRADSPIVKRQYHCHKGNV